MLKTGLVYVIATDWIVHVDLPGSYTSIISIQHFVSKCIYKATVKLILMVTRPTIVLIC